MLCIYINAYSAYGYIQSGLASLLDICYDSSAKHELLKSSEIDCDAFNFQKV